MSAADATGEAASAACPYHWSTAMLALSRTHMTRAPPMSAGTMRISHTSAFSVAMTHT